MNWRAALRPLGPAISRPDWREILRASVGAGIGLTVCTFLVRLTLERFEGGGLDPTLVLIAPLAGTAVLVFAVPSSPLAQPWSAVVGNTVSAVVGVAVVLVVREPWLAMGLSVTLALIAMMLLRATHPPAAGIALGIVLTAEAVRKVGFAYAFSPVFIDSVFLIAVAMVFCRATGRVYPFRQPKARAPRAGAAPAPVRTDALRGILERAGLDANIGPEDLSRLIRAAHREAAQHLFDGLRCDAVMSRAPVTLHGSVPLREIGRILAEHRIGSLPVVDAAGRFEGLVRGTDLPHHPALAKRHSGFGQLLRAGRGVAGPRAREVMLRGVSTAGPSTPLGALIDLLADGAQPSVPVLEDGRLVGIVTRSDLIAALGRLRQARTPDDEVA